MRTLIQDITDFLVCYPEVTAGELGQFSVGDKYLVSGMTRRNRSPREVTCMGVRQWMADYIRASEVREMARAEARTFMVALAEVYQPVPGAPPVNMERREGKRRYKPRRRTESGASISLSAEQAAGGASPAGE